MSKIFVKIVSRFGYFKMVCAVCLLVIVVEVALAGAVIFRPIGEIEYSSEDLGNAEMSKNNNVSDDGKLKISEVYRAGLFKSGGTVSSRPLADKTVERIKSKLRLQCVMKMGGELVAYIHIEGLGLKKCRVGDSVEDMFSVLDISKGRVEISIIGHKVSLSR